MSEKLKSREAKDWYIKSFENFESKLNGESKSFIHGQRKAALQKLGEMSFPTQREEEWKYTNISPLLNFNFVDPLNAAKVEISKDRLQNYLFKGFDNHLLVFINGVFSEELSDIKDLPSGVIVDSIFNADKNSNDQLKKYFTAESVYESAFEALNIAYSYDGLFVYIPKGKVIEKPIQVLYLNGSDSNNILVSPRNLIIAEENTEAQIIANYRGFSNNPYFANVKTNINADENSIVDFHQIVDESDNAYHIENTQIYQKGNSRVTHFSLEFGGSIVRNDLKTKLDDENSEVNYYGLYLGIDEQHFDNHTFVDHAKPNCLSNELYKGILDDNSKGVFSGKILVRQDAQKTNAYQSNKTVLLSKTATIDTKPQLEIYADDVKCSHGATIGHLDDTAYFYIRSRGVPSELAKSMLIRAFANDVIEKIRIDEFKEQINHKIFEHLHRVEI